jgi:hypothetical protein
MSNEAIYAHAFGNPGTFEWIDAIGGVRPDPRPGGSPPTVQGTVIVTPVQVQTEADHQKYATAVATPATFEIQGNMVKPASVTIVVNQRVFWKVWDGTGVTVTDKRLIPSAH